MNLVGYTATALSRNDIEDTPTNKNVVDFAIVELKDLSGNLVVMYDDAEGLNPETQKTCDTNGQVTFFAEPGDYALEINGKAQRINLAANTADYIKLGTGESVQEFADSFALKIFQSPTDGGLTEIQTRTINGGEVYEVRKNSDDSLATIYSDAAGTTEIVQNGTDNKSGSDGVVEFYIHRGVYYITVGSLRSDFTSTIKAVALDESEIDNTVPAIGELVMNTDTKELSLGDGVTVGGVTVGAKEVDNVLTLKSLNFRVGSVVSTKGYHTPGDGGNARYIIVSPVDFTGSPDEKGDHTLNNGNVAVLQFIDHVTLRQYGAKGDGVTDDLSSINAAFSTGRTVVDLGGVYLVSDTVKTKEQTKFVGAGRKTEIKGSSISGAVLMTYDGTSLSTFPNQNLKDFSVTGTATAAVVFTHCTVSSFENITLDGDTGSFSGVHGFIHEYHWGSKFKGLNTNGALLTGNAYRINKVVLDSLWDLPYTSNACEYSFHFDSTLTEYSSGVGTGFGKLLFNMATAQSATRYAFKFANANGITFIGGYTEDCLGLVHAVNATDIHFFSTDLQGWKSGVTTHDIFMECDTSMEGVHFYNTKHRDVKHVIGKITADISFVNPRVLGGASFFAKVERTDNTPSSMPVTFMEQGSSKSNLILKTNSYSWQFGDMQVANVAGNGEWASNPVVVPPITAETAY